MELLKVEGFLVVSLVLYLPKFDRNKEYQMMVMSFIKVNRKVQS